MPPADSAKTTAQRIATDAPLFVHIHIPKNAGTSFDRLLRRNFGTRFLSDYALVETADTRYDAAAFARVVALHPWIRAYASHRVSLDLPPAAAGRPVVALAFVRDPVERFVSHYFFARASDSAYSPDAHRLALGDYARAAAAGELAAPVATVHLLYLTSQLACLADDAGPAGLARVADALAAGRLLLFPTERFAEACVFLERRFPRDFRDCSLAGAGDAARRDLPVSAADRAAIAALTAADRPLCDLARDSFDRLLAAAFPDAARLRRARAGWRRRSAARGLAAPLAAGFKACAAAAGRMLLARGGRW